MRLIFKLFIVAKQLLHGVESLYLPCLSHLTTYKVSFLNIFSISFSLFANLGDFFLEPFYVIAIFSVCIRVGCVCTPQCRYLCMTCTCILDKIIT